MSSKSITPRLAISEITSSPEKLLEMQTSKFELKMQQTFPPYSQCAPENTKKAGISELRKWCPSLLAR
jgi:hypothetical protein